VFSLLVQRKLLSIVLGYQGSYYKNRGAQKTGIKKVLFRLYVFLML
jgi:hypothetical protein